MKKQEALNTFTEGMVMDLNPITTPNNVLTNCLNGTIITFNGNEYVLQNDMGNGRVETAYLPQGYVPMGTAELGGIIYVVSYNPLIDKCQIGCFPSPERNLTTNEIKDSVVSLKPTHFKSSSNSKDLLTLMVKLDLLDGSQFEKLNPGDLFKVYAESGISSNASHLTDHGNSSHIFGELPKHVRLHIAAVDDNNKITYLDDSLKWYDNNYYFQDVGSQAGKPNMDLDEYRAMVSSAYNVFKSKVSGKLCLIAELEVIDSFNATWSASSIERNETQLAIDFKFSWKSNNWNETRDINPAHIINNSNKGTEEYAINSYVMESELNSYEQKQAYTFTKGASDIYTYNLIPAMEFGELPHLAIKGSINLADIGSGKINLIEYRYYRNTNSMLLSWGLEAYPEPGYNIDSVEFKFIPVCDQLKEFTFIKSGLTSYSGNFLDEIPLDVELNSYKFKGTLVSDHLYYVLVTIKYKSETAPSENTSKYVYYTRWFYTSSVFNKYYLDKSPSDFKEIKLDFLELTKQVQQTLTSETINTSEDVPQLAWKDEETPANGQPVAEASLGALIYEVAAKMNIDLSLHYKEDYNIFIIPETHNGTKIINPTNNIETTMVIERVNQNIATESGVADGCVEGLLINENYKDKTNKAEIKLPTDYANSLHFSIDLSGIEYNKICGDKTKPEVCNYSGVVTPLIYNSDSAAKYGLTFDTTRGHFYFGSNLYGISVYGHTNLWGNIYGLTHTNSGLARNADGLLKDDLKMKGSAHSSDAMQSLLKAAANDCGKNIFPVVFFGEGGGSDHLNSITLANSSENAIRLNWIFGNSFGQGILVKDSVELKGTDFVSVSRFGQEGNANMFLAVKCSDDNYYLINMVAPFGSSAESVGTTGKTFGDYVANFLSQLYSINSGENTAVNLNIIDNISYIENYTTKWKSTGNTSINMDTSKLFIQCPLDRTQADLVNKETLVSKLGGVSIKAENQTTDENITLIIQDNPVKEDIELIYEFPVKDSAYFTYKNQGGGNSSLNKMLLWVDGKSIPATLSMNKNQLYVISKTSDDEYINTQLSGFTSLYKFVSAQINNDNIIFTRSESLERLYGMDYFKVSEGELVISDYRVGQNAMLKIKTHDTWKLTNFYLGIKPSGELAL